MVCLKRFLSVSGLLAAIVPTLLATLFCCTSCGKKEFLNKEIPSEGRCLVDAEIVEVDKNGAESSKTLLRSAPNALRSTRPPFLDTEKGRIWGLGFFKENVMTSVRVQVKSGYKCKGTYFRYTTGYDEREFPKSLSPNTLRRSKTFHVTGNITVVAVIEKEEGVEVVIE